jgi:hypothetical protein
VLSGIGELLLPAGAIAFYLYDSLLWLYGDELVLIRSARRWDCAAGPDWLLLRRRLYLPNPFTPQRLLWRACWSAASRSGAPTDLAALGGLHARLWPLRVVVVIELLLVVVALPACVLAGASPLVLLVLLAAIYLVAGAAVAWIWRCRATLGLSARACRSLSVDALACPPFAINLVRKISLLAPVRGELLTQARPVFEPAALEGLRNTLLRRVAGQLAVASAGTAAHTALLNYQHELLEQQP